MAEKKKSETAEEQKPEEAASEEQADDEQKNEAGEESRTKPNAEAVEKVIRTHVGYSLVGGLLPVPLLDIVVITAVQIDMIKQLAAAYGVDFNEERGKSIIGSIMGATAGNFLGRVGASVLKSIPGVGTLLGVGSQVVLAGASTYAVGKAFQAHFEEDGSMFNVNLDKMRDRFREFMEKGKSVAADMQRKGKDEDVFSRIEKLKALRDSGAITEEEFEKTKADLLARLSE